MRSRVLAGVTIIGLVISMGCGGDDDDTTDPVEDVDNAPSKDESGETTTTTMSPADEVIVDYKAAAAATTAFYNPPDPDHPDLLAHYAGDTLSRVQADLRSLQAAGMAYETTTEVHPGEPTITGDTAVLEDCYIDRTQTINLATGQPVGEPGETVLHVQVTLERIDGTWKKTLQERLEETCRPG